MTGMDLQGDKELRRLLGQLGPRIARKVTRGAMNKAATPIVRAAKRNARKLGTRGGRQLAKSIGKRAKTYTAQGVVFVAVGPRFPLGAHGHLVEYGHRVAAAGSGTLKRIHKAGSSKTRKASVSKVTGKRGTGRVLTFVPPHPFLRPAFDSQKRAALTLAINEHRARVEREAQKASYHARAGKIGATWTQIHAAGR